MAKYKILESWHNRCDNAKDDLYAICEREADAKEILLGLGYAMKIKNSLGTDFPKPTKFQRVHVGWLETQSVLTTWIGGEDSSPMSSEYRRIFRIVKESDSIKTKTKMKAMSL